MVAKHFPKGLDGRQRDKSGEIRKKRSDTNVKTLRGVRRAFLDPANLAGRHIRVLVDYWTGNARIADLCRQQGVAMLERPHSTPYIEQQLSFLRVYGDTWIGKPGMVHPLADYVDDPARFKRSYTAKEDRSARVLSRKTAGTALRLATACGARTAATSSARRPSPP